MEDCGADCARYAVYVISRRWFRYGLGILNVLMGHEQGAIPSRTRILSC